MTLRWVVRPNTYHDSVKLLRLSEALAGLAGVERAAAVMATPLNLSLLAGDNLLPPGVGAGPDDLVISLAATDADSAEAALQQVEGLLAPRTVERDEGQPPRLLEAAARTDGANLAVIAVPGPSAALEAYAALRAGLHVFLFSDNVAIEDEVRLKAMALERDLLMMGPDCGTAIIGGVGLGFANRVERGPVGIVGASGTGMQQVCCLLDAAGIGIAQAIGTGGRDLSASVGGLMTRRGLDLLAADPAVEIITVISKPPDEAAAGALHDVLRNYPKPVVACLLGRRDRNEGAVRYAPDLTAVAALLCQELGLQPRWDAGANVRGRAGFHSRVYGLYSGGTLASEAAQILDDHGVPHALVDLGADQYTHGRAHPMIDPRLRVSALTDVNRHGDAGVILLDVVLGDLAHPDPAGALLSGIEAHRAASDVPIIAALVGARHDPQGLERQRRTLEDAGVTVFASNADAARAAATLLGAGS